MANFFAQTMQGTSDEAMKRKGQWNVISSIPFVFGVHTLVDALQPLADLNRKFQAVRSMLCEIDEDWTSKKDELQSLMHGKQGASRLDFMARFRFPKYRPSKDRQSTDDEDADAIDDLDIPLRDNERRRSCRLAGSGDDNEDWKQTCDDVHVEIYTLLYKEATNYGEEIPEWVLACSIFDFRKEFPVKDKYGEFLVQMKPKINTLRELVMNVKALHTDRDLVLPEVNPDESKDSSESESSDDNDDEASEGQGISLLPASQPKPSLRMVVAEYNKALGYFSKLSRQVRKRTVSHADAHKKFLDEKGAEFPLLAAMDSFQLITSPTSAQDERYIAAMKFIKTLPRNRMHNVTLNACMHVRFNDFAEIDYEKVAKNLPAI